MADALPLKNDFSVTLDPRKTLDELTDNDIVAYHHMVEYVAARNQTPPVEITLPASMPPGVTGKPYELFLTCTGGGASVVWEQYGDTIDGQQILPDQQTGGIKWIVPALPAAATYAIKFKVTGENGTVDTIEYSFVVAAGQTNAAISDTTLVALRVGTPAVWNFTCTGTGPFRFRVTAGQALPAGVAFTTDSVDNPAVQNVLTGTPTAGSERAGASTTIGITGANGVEVTKVFASGAHCNRDPDCTNEGGIPVLSPGSSWSYQLNLVGMEAGVAATVARTGGAAWPAWVTSLSSAGLLSGTDPVASAGTSTGNIVLTVTAGSKTTQVNINLTVAASTVDNSPPLAATYWFDADAGVTLSGGNVTAFLDQQASLSATAAAGQGPTPDTGTPHSLAFASSPTPLKLTAASMALALPWYVAGYVYIPTGISDGASRYLWSDTSVDPRIVYIDNGTNQHRINMIVGGVPCNGVATDVNRGAWNLVECWVGSDGSWGIAVNGNTAATGAAGAIAAPVAWSGLMFGHGTASFAFAHKQHRAYFRSGTLPDTTQRGNIRTWLQASWSNVPTPPPAQLDIIDERNDSRTVGYFVPARGFADASANMEWNSPRREQPGVEAAETSLNPGVPVMVDLPFIPEQTNNWTGKVRSIPPSGLVVTSAGVKAFELVDDPLDSNNTLCKFYVGVDTPNQGKWNSYSRGRARFRPMDCYNRRFGSTPGDIMWQAVRFVFGYGMAVNTDLRNMLFALTHVKMDTGSSLLTGGGGWPYHGPNCYLGGTNPSTPGVLAGNIMRFGTERWDQSTGRQCLSKPLLYELTGVQENVYYDFVFNWRLSWRDDEGFQNTWMRSPAHFGGAITKIINDVGSNFPLDTQANGAALGPELYDWRNRYKYVDSSGRTVNAFPWTAPCTSHTMWVGPTVVQKQGTGSVTQSAAMFFDWLTKRSKKL